MSRLTNYHNQSPKESAYWHFRINDLSEEQFNMIKNCSEVQWIVIGEIEKEDEKGEHYHVAIKFNRSYRKQTVLNKLLYNTNLINDRDYYLETKYTKSTVLQFIEYVIKNGVRFDTYGLGNEEETSNVEIPKMSKVELQRLRIEKIRAGDEDWFLENDFDFMLGSKYAKLVVLCQPHCNDILQGDLENYWIWGPSGTCKSATVHHLWPDAYSKVCSNEKWDNYSNTLPGHKVVHVEEVDDFTDIEKGLEGLAGVKRMADRYPFPVRMNYGSRNLMIRPKTIVITSNFSPSQILSTPDKHGNVTRGLETQLKALGRKFHIMHIDQFKKKFNLRDVWGLAGDGITLKVIGVELAGANSEESIPYEETEEYTERKKQAMERTNMNQEDARYWGEEEA